MSRWLLALPLLAVPGVAMADPITFLAALAPYIGSAAAAAVYTAAVFVSTYGGYIYAAYSVYGGIQARRSAKKQAAAARVAYNASLTDRFATTLRADPPWRVIYGRCITGGDIVGIFTSDKSSVDDGGTAYTKPDAYKHLVVAVAAHECEAIHEVYIDGVPVGALDGSGWATAGEFMDEATSLYQERTLAPGASTTFDSAPTYVAGRYVGASDDDTAQPPITIVGNTVTNPSATLSILVGMRIAVIRPLVRVEIALGTASQTASTYLQAQCPAEWTAADRLRGIAYVIVTIDLEEARFQGGPPALTFDVSGRKIYDPRTAVTAWSRNPALVVRDWLTQPWGFGVDAADLDDASIIAAANACDVTINLAVGGDVSPGFTYTADGAVTSDASPEAVLDELCNAMGGFATHSGGLWVVNAGVYTAPVLALTEDMQAGSIDVVQAGVGYDELFNGVRARMVERTRSVESEIDPYTNAAYVAADGRELWADISLPWTSNRARARNLARILVEQTRESLVIRYAAQLHAWPLQVGDRVTVTSAEYGWTAKVFRVTDWQWSVDSAVILTLQEDAASIYDQADAATADSVPNTGLPSPWQVAPITGLSATSGTAAALRHGDGTVTQRVRVAWSPITGAYVTQGGQVKLRWRRLADPAGTWRELLTRGDATAEYLTGVQAGDALIIRATVINSLGAESAAVIIGHTVEVDNTPPAAVAGFAGSVSNGRVSWVWTPSVDVYYAATEVRSADSDWGSATVPPLFRGAASGWQESVAAATTLTRYARHITVRGNASASSAAATVGVVAGDLLTADAIGAVQTSLGNAPAGILNSSLTGVIAAAATTAEWSGVTGTNRPADNASNDLRMTLGPNYAQAGNRISKTPSSSNAWDFSSITASSYVGGAWIEGVNNSNHWMVCLTDNPSMSTSYDSTTTYAFHGAYDQAWGYVNGANVWGPISLPAAAVCAVQYEGDKIRFFVNGAIVDTRTVAKNQRVYGKVSLYYANESVQGVRFGPMSSAEPGATVNQSDAFTNAAIALAQATADGKIDTFWQATAPGSASEGDIWFDTDDGYKQYRRTSGAWVLAADARIGIAIDAASDAQATADGKVTTFVAATAPTAEAVGDLWLDSDDGNKLYRWSGSAWVALTVGTGAIAANAATEVVEFYDAAGVSYSNMG